MDFIDSEDIMEREINHMLRLFRKRKTKPPEKTSNIQLHFPSVAVYKDRKSSVIYLNPSVIHPTGGSSTNKKYIKLESPYTEYEVGRAIKDAIQISIDEPYLPEGVKGDFWIDAEGVKSIISFIRTKCLISVTQIGNEGKIRISVMKKYKTTGYTHSKDDPEYLVDDTISEVELGRVVLKGFSKCT